MGSWTRPRQGSKWAHILQCPAFTPESPVEWWPQWTGTTGGSWIQQEWVKAAMKRMCRGLFGDQAVAQAILLGGRCDFGRLHSLKAS
jgi:hypothetical protein